MADREFGFSHYYADEDDYRMKPKICPLTGERVIPELHDFDCLIYNCSAVAPDRWSLLYGHKYRCEWERTKIEEWHERRVKTAETYKRLSDSLETARKIDIDEFFRYCDDLDKDMVESRQQYSPDMIICPYHAPGDKCLLYLFEDGVLVEISVSDNIFAQLGRRFDRLTSETVKCEISCCDVPGYMADAINVRLHLEHNMDVKAILHHDNPVYIKSKGIAKYIDAAYGWDWLTFNRMRARHLEMTEIPNYDNVIYIKQELDEIIRSES